MSESPTPRTVFERLSRGISEERWKELADLYAEDAVVERPFAGAAHGRIEGRETIRAHFGGTSAAGLRLVARNVVVHKTTDPEVIIAEYDYDITSDRRTATVANVQVLRIRDGLIRWSRDYHDHLAIARLTGRLAELTGDVR